MGQAIRNAQALGLHKDCTTASNVHEEMRHRLWWDLVDSDTYAMYEHSVVDHCLPCTAFSLYASAGRP